jgi:lysophospholipase L1-like esterase
MADTRDVTMRSWTTATRRLFILGLAGLAVVLIAPPAQGQAGPEARWAAELRAFDDADAKTPPSKGGIVFVGSSSIRLWNLETAFPGLPVVNRGFGGSQLADSVEHLDRLVLRHAPKTVVLYAGDNDLSAGKTPAQVVADFEAFAAGVHRALPQARIAFVAIKPSLARWKLIAQVREANAGVRAVCDADDRLGFIDVDGPMLGYDAKPRGDLFVTDGLHLSPKGYALWTTLTRPFVE